MGHPCAIHEIIGKYEEPRPAYTTVATFLKILTNKKFVDFKKGEGKTQLYFPVISRAQYTRQAMEDMKNNLFDGCASSLVKFFVSEEIRAAYAQRNILPPKQSRAAHYDGIVVPASAVPLSYIRKQSGRDS